MSEASNDRVLPNILAGGVAGGFAACITCPFDVVKTRSQSSMLIQPGKRTDVRVPAVRQPQWVMVLRDLVKIEGWRAVTKGLGPSLAAVIPTRAVYFTVYTQSKEFYSGKGLRPISTHILASCTTGLINATWTNPLFVLKTRQQLTVDKKGRGMLSVWQCAKDTYKADGLRGFGRGMSGSYAGISETVVQLVLYEQFKHYLITNNTDSRAKYLGCSLVAAGGAKFIATTMCYPHEVVRTRLREQMGQNRKYHKFFQTMALIQKEEGFKGLYRGLAPQLMKVVPNHAIMFLTFEYIMSVYRSYQPQTAS